MITMFLAISLISFWITKQLCSETSNLLVLDYPNERSLHSKPIPKTGGLAILVAFFGGCAGIFLMFPWDHFYDAAIFSVLGGMLIIALVI